MERRNPTSLAAPVMNLYSQIAIAPAGRLAFVSGQVAIDESGTFVGVGDHGAQARQCLINLKRAMEDVGATPADFVQMRLFVVDHDPKLIPVIMVEAARAVFGGEWPLCASTYVGVASLGLPEWLIEIDAVIAVPDVSAS